MWEATTTTDTEVGNQRQNADSSPIVRPREAKETPEYTKARTSTPKTARMAAATKHEREI